MIICLKKIINKETNNEIIESIDFESISPITCEEFKKNLNEYIDKKINRTKPELTETIKLMTYSATGLSDLKFTLDYKTFNDYNELEKYFDIKINYISCSVYSIILNQKEFDLVGKYSIDDAILLIKKEIKQRAIEKQIQNQIVL
jgi:translation initiation factor 2 alpha subunit (eIF-2alpha)